MPAMFAPVMPIAVAQRLSLERSLQPDYVLLLADDVLSHPEAYGSLYRDRPMSVTVILDNGAAEEGRSLPLERLREAAELVEPTWIVLPDVIHNSEYTVSCTLQADKELRSGHPVMIVPQGNSLEEYVWCLRQILTKMSPRPFILGLSKFIEDHSLTRASILKAVIAETRQIQSQQGAQQHVIVHLLGFTRNLQDDVACAASPSVVGIDSATPIWVGQRSELLPAQPPPSDTFGHRPPGYMRSYTTTPEVVANVWIVGSWLRAAWDRSHHSHVYT